VNAREVILELRAAEAEFEAARVAITRLLRVADQTGASLEEAGIRRRDVLRCLDNLERTYVVRLFAVFEGRLRDAWTRMARRHTEPPIRHVMDACAARRRVDPVLLAAAHGVREFRNSIVHGGPAAIVTLGQARSILCRYFAWVESQ
jgi:hypothetical protein